jgi:nicotinamidase-related amidase
MDRFRLRREETAVLVVDIQERLCKVMSPERLERMVNRTCALIRGAHTLGLPVFYTEQYPKGLGPTIEPVRACLENATRYEKMKFSSWCPELHSALAGKPRVLIAGMESHICVFQTARDFVEQEFVPYLCRDAIISRSDEDRESGLRLANEAGAVLTTVESALFDMLGEAGTPEFKAISQAVK